jgi:hypothetical protein
MRASAEFFELPGLDGEVDSADGDAGGGDEPGWQVGMDDGVQDMQQETAPIAGQACARFEIQLVESERTGPWTRFDEDSPKPKIGCATRSARGARMSRFRQR